MRHLYWRLRLRLGRLKHKLWPVNAVTLAKNVAWEKQPYDDTRCEWHMHSMFRRCQNGLTLREYLARAASIEREGAVRATFRREFLGEWLPAEDEENRG